MKISDNGELQQIAQNHSSHISTEDFINIHKEYTGKRYYFLVDHTTLASGNPLKFRKNLTNI